jgi:hypothetical protein
VSPGPRRPRGAPARIERCFRDVHTATQHGALAARTLDLVGPVRLGVDPQGLL